MSGDGTVHGGYSGTRPSSDLSPPRPVRSANVKPQAAHPTPAPGGRTRDAREQIAVEQIARWLVREYGELIDRDPPGYWEFQARELIDDCPAIADALGSRGRVEALAEELDAYMSGAWSPDVYDVAVRLRRALGDA